MNAIDYDLEFIEDGRTIEIISIALVAETGDHYYAVNGNDAVMDRAAAHPWLSDHVVPSLPVRLTPDLGTVALLGSHARHPVKSWQWDADHADWPRVLPLRRIADEVRQFICSFPEPELWANYGAYDHVALCQLWGSMIDLPRGIPMFTNDVQQEARRLRIQGGELPQQTAGEHNALADAWHNQTVRRWLAGRRP
jgi:hypothetical protein